MFDNIGEKIKITAKVFAYIGAAAAVIAYLISSFYFLIIDFDFVMLLGAPFICISSYAALLLMVFLLYGFGSLIENTEIIADHLTSEEKNINENVQSFLNVAKKDEAAEEQNVSVQKTAHKWRCDKCGNMTDSDPCSYCGATFATTSDNEK